MCAGITLLRQVLPGLLSFTTRFRGAIFVRFDRVDFFRIDVDELDIECQNGVRWDNFTGPGSSICFLSWTVQLGLHSLGHMQKGLIPAFDNAIFSNLENKWFVTLETGVELLAIEKFTLVVHTNTITLLGLDT